MHRKVIKQKAYKEVKHKPLTKEHFEVEQPKDFSELVARNIKQNALDEEDEDSGVFNMQNFNTLRRIENIQEANEEDSNSPVNDHDKTQSKLTSFMNRFHDPKSSSSSDNNRQGMRMHTSSYDSKSANSSNINNESRENLIQYFTQKEPSRNPYRNALLTDPKIIRNPTDIIIHQVQETKFVSNTDGVSQICHDSEMVDRLNDENAQKITRLQGETRVVRSDSCGDTSNYQKTKSFANANKIGKSTRSRNVQNPIKASLGSNDSQSGLLKERKFEDQESIDKTLDQTLRRVKNHKRKINEQSTMPQQNSNDELSDFETFRNMNSELMSSYKANLKARVSKAEHDPINDSEVVATKLKPEKRTRNQLPIKSKGAKTKQDDKNKNLLVNPPKIMGFFEDESVKLVNLSRNIDLNNAKTASIHLRKFISCFINTYSNTCLC